MDEVAARARLFSLLLARYPNTRLDAPELTLEAWIADTAHLPLEELRACIDFAVAADSGGFVPTSGKILEAFVSRRTERVTGVPIGNPCTLEELKLTAAWKARGHLRELRDQHVERVTMGALGGMVDGLIGSMGRKLIGEPKR